MVEFKNVRMILSIMIILLLTNCALQLPPEGGEIDLIPPEVVSTFPENGTVNYNEKYFEINFSEYVDKRSFREALFISPTIEGEMNINWSGKNVEVYFPKGFKENTTYVITIGTDVFDLHNKNRMANAFTLYFSTGDKIDKKNISGYVYDSQADGTMLFVYAYKSDTTNYLLNKADYISQSGKDGSFSIQGLPQGTFRIFAVKDEFRDLLFQPEQDLIGVPYTDVTLNPEDTIFRNLNFVLTKIDTTSPHFLSAVMTDRNHLLITFSENLDTSSLKASNFSLIDSTNNSIIPLDYVFKVKGKENELFISFNGNINIEHNYYLKAEGIIDKNKNLKEVDYIPVTANDKPDTNFVSIIRVEPPYNNREIDFIYPKFDFYFDDGFDVQKLYNSIYVGDTIGNQVNTSLIKIDDAHFQILIDGKLKPSSYYVIRFNLSQAVDAAGNMKDSVFIYSFYTKSGLEFTGLSGQIINVDLRKNPLLKLKSITSPEKVYKQYPKENGQFEFKRIEPGKYNLICFLDEDKNGIYSEGFPFPFIQSERIKYYNEEINLPPRWEVTNLIFDFEN